MDPPHTTATAKPSPSNRYGLVALLNTGSPQSFTSAEAWARTKHNNSASDTCEQNDSPRSWGGFGKSAPLLTSIAVRLSTQFWHNNTPSAEDAVGVYIVPHGTTKHPVLLGRDSSMRFEQRTYTTLPRSPSGPSFGELSLTTPYTDDLSTFIYDNRPSPTR